MEHPAGPPDPILKSRRYVLGEEEDTFAIWDLEAPGEPLERFPASAEGFEAAKTRYKALKRAGRRDRRAGRWARIESRLPRFLFAGIVVGAALWLVGAILIHTPGITMALPGVFFQVGFLIDDIGFRLMAVSVSLAIGLSVLRRVERPEMRPSERIWPPPPDPLEKALMRTIVVGVGVWLVAGALAAWFPWSPFDSSFAAEPGVLSFVEEPSSLVGRIAAFIDSLAFRVWVVAAVLLGLRWAWRWRTGEPSEAAPGP